MLQYTQVMKVHQYEDGRTVTVKKALTTNQDLYPRMAQEVLRL